MQFTIANPLMNAYPFPHLFSHTNYSTTLTSRKNYLMLTIDCTEKKETWNKKGIIKIFINLSKHVKSEKNKFQE